jgi:hypothetical protein
MSKKIPPPVGVNSALARAVNTRQQSKLPWDGTPDRSKATMPAPAAQQGDAQTRSQIDTYFTRIGGTNEIYGGDRQWALITLVLENAGPVAVGTDQDLTPVLSGKGQLLQTGEPLHFTIAKGQKLYVAATSINRIKRTIGPVPWLEQITGLLRAMGVK